MVDDHRPKTLMIFKANEGYCIYYASINLEKKIVLKNKAQNNGHSQKTKINKFFLKRNKFYGDKPLGALPPDFGSSLASLAVS